MFIKIRTDLFRLSDSFILPLSPDFTGDPSATATSLDFGFDFDEAELVSELIASLPASLADHPIRPVEVEDFESLYRWFCS